jgi:hypothetical protein
MSSIEGSFNAASPMRASFFIEHAYPAGMTYYRHEAARPAASRYWEDNIVIRQQFNVLRGVILVASG